MRRRWRRWWWNRLDAPAPEFDSDAYSNTNSYTDAYSHADAYSNSVSELQHA